MLNILSDVIRDYDGFVELRYHAKTHQSLRVAQGRLESSTVRHRNGVGVRVLEGGTWGFASTGECSPSAIRTAVEQARVGARAAAYLPLKGGRRRRRDTQSRRVRIDYLLSSAGP